MNPQSNLAADPSALQARHNIALFHRDHMRFYVTTQLEVAADLSREANKIKVFGDYWLREEKATASSFDAADPRFRAAGCGDLTPLTAIAGMGILFMEGEGEPDEIRLLKEKLRAYSYRFTSKGEWLAEKMEMAWQRESVLLSPESIDAAWPRLRVVAIDWQGAKETVMVGKLLGLALERLVGIDFTPSAIRKNRPAFGKMLLSAGWMIDMAARILSKVATDLSQADPDMTAYLAFVENASTR